MRDEDVLISDYRVTVLGEEGQFIFDWVNNQANTVEFMPSESDFNDYTAEVRSVLQRNGVSIIDDDTQESNDNEPSNLSDPDEKTARPGPIGEGDADQTNNNPEPSEETDNDGFKPTDNSNIGSGNDSVETNESTEDDNKATGNEMMENTTTTNNRTNTRTEGESDETFSFIVRMSDPTERREIIEKLRHSNQNAADKLELSGPFRVTYKPTDNGIELIGVEDLGTGTSVTDS